MRITRLRSLTRRHRERCKHRDRNRGPHLLHKSTSERSIHPTSAAATPLTTPTHGQHPPSTQTMPRPLLFWTCRFFFIALLTHASTPPQRTNTSHAPFSSSVGSCLLVN